MNLAKNGTLHTQLCDEETVLVENAIRLAIDSIINVLYGVNSARSREYQRMVADRDREIRRLENRLREIEHELQLLRTQGCTCGLFVPGSQASGDRQGGFEADCVEPEVEAGQQECEMSISLDLFARSPSHVSSQSHESAIPSSPSKLCLDQACTSHSSETSGGSETARNLPPSPSSLVVKEEPCDIDTVLIKWEMSEERIREQQESTDSPHLDRESPGVKKKQENRERKKFREKPQANPDGPQITEEEHPRNKKKSVPMSELPEEAQRLKRAAWRAASRRYYARKIARQQANPSCSGRYPHISAAQFSQPISFVDKRRRTLISELPEESQTLQREAWRAASRRYYARKTARHQADPTQYGHLLQT
ncbi:uncharacterized protein LOC115045209 [Echeneis naucrates]|uniref:uncharacterized protein LOC115045209 n=1 Tax=Echeneis naucrates TaxID=173247 RepID=UPI0011138943|nr:uncharacterized protein LOC115045209 [Echeneis naucrates]